MSGELFLAFNDDRAIALPRDLRHYDSPKDDNERLLTYQYEWLVNNDGKAREKLWLLSYRIARRMIAAKLMQKGVVLDSQALQDRAVSAVMYVLRRYEYGWYVRKAYLRAIKWGVVHSLFHRTKAEELVQTEDEETMSRLAEREPDDGRIVYVEGMTTEEARNRIRTEFFPEIAERILEKISIIGGKK